MKKLLLLLPLLLANVAHSAEAVNVPAGNKTVNSVKQTAAKAEQPKAVDLKTAYKREYAFLEAQKRELKKRLIEFNTKSKRDERKLLNKIDSLERGSVTRADTIEEISSQLNDAELKNSAGMDRDEALQMTYSQAESTLKKYQIETDTKVNYTLGTDQEKVLFIFDKALELVENLGKQRKSEGKFFLTSGKEVQGDIIQLGNIAAFGVRSESSGTLVPAGGSTRREWVRS